jgi:outer membrane protein assembly factor BamB
LPHYNQTAWTRHLLWRPGKYTFVLDEVTAEAPGDYSFVLGWRSLGQPNLEPGRFESAQDERRRAGLILAGSNLVAAVTANSGRALRSLSDYDALFYRASEPGDFVEVALKVPQRSRVEAVIRTLSFSGRGTIQVMLDGQPLGKPMDLYTAGAPRSVETTLGSLTLSPGEHRLRFVVVGRNEASDAYTFAVSEIGFYRAGERRQARTLPSRFRLLFPPRVPATLDRDTETLGKYLPPSPNYDQALNIVEQSQSQKLQTGETACFQNLFYATEDPSRQVELRQLNDHCALVKSGAEIALIGGAVAGTKLSLGGLQVAGKLFCLTPSQTILHQSTATFNGKPLTAAGRSPSEAMAKCLQAAWRAASRRPTPVAAASGPSALRPLWQRALRDTPLALAAYRARDGQRLAVGQVGGAVSQYTASGQPAGSIQIGGPVHTLLGCNLEGDDAQELLVGSDEETLRALRPDLSEIWEQKVPFLANEQPWDWWTLGSAKVRRLYADDINGDGRPEVLAGVGNMRLHCYDVTGKELWRYRTDHGICTTITSADVFGEGKRRVLAGNGLTSSNGTCWVLDEQGKVLQSYFNGSWCTSLPAIVVGDLDGDGQQTVFCGNNRGDVRAYAGVRGSQEPLWVRNLTRPVRSLQIVPRPAGGLVAVGADSGYLCAFDQAGAKAWGLPLTSAITHTLLVRRAATAPLLAAGCKDGKVFLVTSEGKAVGCFDGGGRLQDLSVADLDGDQRDEVIGVSAGPNRIWAFAVPR